MCKSAKRAALLTACALTCLEAGLSAQPVWTDQSPDRALSIEFLKPEFEGEDNADFMTSATFLSGRFVIGQNMDAEVEIPLARYGVSTAFRDASETVFGNPYLGVRHLSSNVVTRVGVRIPLASDSDPTSLTAGRLADFDRFEAFLPDVLAVNASVSGPLRLSDNAALNLGMGPVVLVSTQDGGGDDTELYAQYSALAELTGGKVTVKSGFTGRALLTEPDLDFGERSSHQFGVGAGLNAGAIRPGLHLRVPLDEDLTEDIDYVLGVNATVILD